MSPAMPGEDGLAIWPFGDRAWLVEPVGEPGPHWALVVARAARQLWPEATTVPGLASVLVARPAPDPRHPELTQALHAALVAALGPAVDPPRGQAEQRLHRIPVRYGGPDLAPVAAGRQVSVEEFVARHRAARWTVAAVGFSPGFGYLTCEDPLFAGIQRRAHPRPRVPAGAVALAAGMCAVYPSASPGGWQLIGQSSVRLFRSDVEPPAVLVAGDVVRFEEDP